MDLNKIFKNLEWKVLLVFFIIAFAGEFILQFVGRYWNFAWILRVPFLMFLIYRLYLRVRSYRFLHTLILMLPVYLLGLLIWLFFGKLFGLIIFIPLPFWQVVFLFLTAVLASWLLSKPKFKKIKLAFPLALGLYLVGYVVRVVLQYFVELMLTLDIPYVLSILLLDLYHSFAYPLSVLFYASGNSMFVPFLLGDLNYFLVENLPVG